jgi:two-component system, OmpR family, phosphate regulon sensor histidine kinase PhoR
MNGSSTSAFSLYQLARAEETGSPVMSSATLQSLVGALLDLLLAEQAIATLWLKFTPGDRCWSEIESYQRQVASPSVIYLCNSPSDCPPPNLDLVPVQLQGGVQLQGEVLVLARSPQFSALIVAQQQDNLEQFRVICSFEPSVIGRVCAGIQQAIATTEVNTPFLWENLADPPGRPSLDPSRLTHLLLDRLATSPSPSPSPAPKDKLFSRGLQELSSTLTRMKTALSLLRSPSLKPTQRQRYLEMLQQECDRQNSLICGMRSLVELDSGVEDAVTEPVQLADFVPSIVSTYQPLAMEKGIQLGYTIPAELPPITCPPNWLRQIIVNLLNNSLRFTPPNGKVTVQASRQGEYVQLAFKDTGIGIAPHELSKIFDCFYRGRASTGEDKVGAGLGLTSVQQLLLRCGGSISVTSQPNKGATFKVLLPVAG